MDLIFHTPIVGCIVVALLQLSVTGRYPFKKVKQFVLSSGGDGRPQRIFIGLGLHPATFWVTTIASVLAALIGHANAAMLGVSPHAWFVISFGVMSWALFMHILYFINATLMYMAAGGRL